MVTNAFSQGFKVHTILGLAIMAAVVIIMLAGYLSYRIQLPVGRSWMTSTIRVIHKTGGFIVYFLGLVNVYFGAHDLAILWQLDHTLEITVTIIAVLVPIGLFIYARIHQSRSRKTAGYELVSESLLDSLPVFEWGEVNTRVALGSQWVVIGDALVDVSKLIKSHPGGEEVIRPFIGLDVTKIFYRSAHIPDAAVRSGNLTGLRGKKDDSADSKETDYSDVYDDIPLHEHSRLAQYIICSHMIGRIKTETYSPSMFDLMAEGLEVAINDKSSGSRKPVHVDRYILVKLDSKRKLSSETSTRAPVYAFRFKFQDPEATLNASPGIH